MDGVKDKVMNIFKTSISKDYSKPKRIKNANRAGRKPRKLNIQKQTKESIIRNLFKLKKYNKVIKDRIIRDIKTLFEQEDDYYKPVGVGKVYRNNYIEYESNSDKNKTLSIREYLHKIKPYLKDIINDLQKSESWKTQLTIAINFFSSKGIHEERIMHSNNDDMEIMSHDKADEVLKNF